MSEQEICASTGASFDNFKRWQRRVLKAQAGLPPHLHMVRQRMQVSSTDAEVDQVVDKLALALGATRPEVRTRKALLAVIDLLNRPEMSEQEVCASTGASFDDFKRWQRRVLNAQAGLPPPTDERY